MKTAVITGITGQDGSYLAELLLEKGYRVIGVARRSSTDNQQRIRHLLRDRGFHLEIGDVTDAGFMQRVLDREREKTWDATSHIDLDRARLEIYSLAAQSHVQVSFEEPAHTSGVDYLGVLNILEWIRRSRYKDQVRLYQASTSEMFGVGSTIIHLGDYDWERLDFRTWEEAKASPYAEVLPPKQDELTPMLPCSPYAIAKLAAHHLCRVYRDSYAAHISCGILFNHGGPRRGHEFVDRKISQYVGRLANKSAYEMGPEKLRLGNLDARRDWGHARDYVKGMWLMLQQDIPGDYVLATGETWSVRDFLKEAFSLINKDYEDYVEMDTSLLRPSEVPYLRGDATRAQRQLGWKPGVSFKDLVREMVDTDIWLARGDHVDGTF